MLHRRTLVLLFVLATFSALMPSMVPSARASLYHFFDGVADPPPNYPGGGQAVAIYNGLWGGQNFQASASYNITRVALWACDVGTAGDSSTVDLRSDSAGNPNMVSPALASATTTAPACPNYAWVNFSFPTPVQLTSGTIYWVVLKSTVASSTNGWDWWNTRGNNFIPPNRPGKQSANQGGTWANAPGDFELRTFGYTGASITLAKGVNQARAWEGDVLRYTLYLNNSGTEAAPIVWVNDTLPIGLAYLSDNASQVGGNRTGPSNWTFTNLGTGPHYFIIYASVTIGIAPGTTLINTATLDYRDFNGAAKPRSTATASTLVNVAVKNLYMRSLGGDTLSTNRPTVSTIASVTINRGGGTHDWIQRPPAAASLHLRDKASVYLAVDTGGHTTETVNASLFISDGVNPPTLIGGQERVQTFDGITGTYENLAPFIMGGLNRTIPRASYLFLRVTDKGADNINVGYNSTTLTARVDLNTDTYVSVDALSARDQNGLAGAFVYNDTMVVHANVSDPLGASDIAGARINITDPTGAAVVPTVPMTLEVSDTSSLPLWRLYRYSYSIPFPTAEGSYRIRVMGAETNGVAINRTVDVGIRNALLQLGKIVDSPTARQGDILTYTIYFNNTGTGTAPRAWINDTPPPGLSYTSDNASAAGGSVAGNLSWAFTGVTPGSHFFWIKGKVVPLIPGGTLVQNRATLDFQDPKGNPQPRRVAFASALILGPQLVFGLGSSKGGYNRAEVVRYVVYLNNTGTEVARTVVINFTAPSELQYQSDSSGSLGGNATLQGSTVRFTLNDLSVGFHSFVVNYTVLPTAPGGISLPAYGWANFSDGSGASYSPLFAVATPSLIGPHITVVSLASRATFNPGDWVTYRLMVNNTGAFVEAAPTLTLRLYLDNNTRFASACPGGAFDPTLNSVRWDLTNVPAGFHGVYVVNVSVAVGLPPALVLTAWGRADYVDGVGNPAPVVLYSALASVTAPRLAPSLSQDLGTLMSGTRVKERVYYNNTGNGVARDTWVNITLAPGWDYSGHDAESGSFSVIGRALSWHFANVVPGQHHLDLFLQAGILLVDGYVLSGSGTLTYTDYNGNGVGAIALQNFTARALAPRLAAILEVSSTTLNPREVINLTLTVENNGSVEAREVWINDTVDAYLAYLTDDSGLIPQRTLGGSSEAFSWHLAGLQPGQSRSIRVTLQVRLNVPPGTVITDYFTVDNTDAGGQGRSSLKSQTLTLTAVAPSGGPGLNPIIWLPLGAAVALAVALAFVLLYRRGNIEEIFLVNYGGTLMAHLATSLTPDRDRDIVTAMLTAIQDFIREAFVRSREGELRHMDFGNHSILIQRGVYSYLAVVLKGRVGRALPRAMKGALTAVEGRYAEVMKTWDGEVIRMAGAKELLYEHLAGHRWR